MGGGPALHATASDSDPAAAAASPDNVDMNPTADTHPHDEFDWEMVQDDMDRSMFTESAKPAAPATHSPAPDESQPLPTAHAEQPPAPEPTNDQLLEQQPEPIEQPEQHAADAAPAPFGVPFEVTPETQQALEDAMADVTPVSDSASSNPTSEPSTSSSPVQPFSPQVPDGDRRPRRNSVDQSASSQRHCPAVLVWQHFQPSTKNVLILIAAITVIIGVATVCSKYSSPSERKLKEEIRALKNEVSYLKKQLERYEEGRKIHLHTLTSEFSMREHAQHSPSNKENIHYSQREEIKGKQAKTEGSADSKNQQRTRKFR